MQCDNGSTFRRTPSCNKAIEPESSALFSTSKKDKMDIQSTNSFAYGWLMGLCNKICRQVLNAILRNQTIDDEVVQTLGCEVEAILYVRQLTKVPENPQDLNPITTNDLLLL